MARERIAAEPKVETAFGSTSSRIPQAKDVIVGELAQAGLWVTISVETLSFWPIVAQRVEYRGHIVWVLPLMVGYCPAVTISKPPSLSEADCERLLMRFLSAVSWVERRGFLPISVVSTNRPAPRARVDPFGSSISQEFRLVYLPEPTDERAMLALALMREGRGLNHAAYAFLSYWRVLEHALPDTGRRVAWTISALSDLKDRDARSAIARLEAAGIIDVARHLFDARRSAIAHARGGVIINPDDPSQLRAVDADLPIIAALAERAIEDILGVKTSWTVYDEHLFELSGFKRIIGDDLVEATLNEADVDEGRTVNFPRMDIRIRRREQHQTLSNMSVCCFERNGRILRLALRSNDGFAEVRIDLDLENERLIFDPFNGLYGEDDGSPEAAEAAVDMKSFGNELLLNGEIQIFNSESGELIARKEAFYLTNAIFDSEAAEDEVRQWREIAAERRNPNLAIRHAFDRLARRYRTTLIVTVAARASPGEAG